MTTNETDAQMLACIEAAMREDLSNNISLEWMDLETGFDSSGRPCGDVIMLLYNNATRLIALARDGLRYREMLRESAEAMRGQAVSMGYIVAADAKIAIRGENIDDTEQPPTQDGSGDAKEEHGDE